MSTEPELDALRVVWAASARNEESGFRVDRRRSYRALRVRYVLHLAFAAAVIAFALAFVRTHLDLEMLIWAVVVCTTTAWAVVFQVRNWRGLLKNAGQSVTDFAEVYERRLHATLREVRFGYRFLALQLAISVPWLTFKFLRGGTTPVRYAVGTGLLALVTAVFLVSLPLSRRRALRELDRVRDFRRELLGEWSDRA